MKTRRFPGKLYLMGEYFITQTNGEAIVMAVDRFITTHTIESNSFSLESDYGTITKSEKSSPKMEIAMEAVLISYEYLEYLKFDRVPLKINIESNLLENGLKIGLGSSAVVIVAIIQSILESHSVFLEKIKLFKLAVLCQKRLGDLSSGGDLAASIFSGLVYYRKYDDSILKDLNSFETLDLKWPKLKIENLKLPKDFEVMVAWTKKTNKTDDYLKVFNERLLSDQKTYADLTKRAEIYVKMFVEGSYKQAFSEYRQLMLELQEWTQLDIETCELTKGIELSLKEGASAKVSGSGGGDCMVAITTQNKDQIIESWTRNNLKYLDIGVWNNDTITKKR